MENIKIILPSGKKVKIKSPTIEETEKFNLFGVMNSVLFDKHIVVGKCKNCGHDLTLDDFEKHCS